MQNLLSREFSRLAAVAICLLLGIVPASWGQSGRPGPPSVTNTGTTQLGILGRLRDAARTRDQSFAILTVTYRDGTLSTTLEKKNPSALFVRAKLDGKPIKLARGSKPAHLENVASGGELLVDIERPVFSTRQRGECVGYLSEGTQEVLIYPGGEDGVACTFYPVAEAGGSVEVKAGSEEMISEWEKGLSFEQFELVGECLNEHERGSVEFWTCVEEAGVPTPGSSESDG